MSTPLTLARVWRILKEVDLEAIRREAARRFRVLIVAETTSDADDLAVRLAGGQSDPTPWLTAIDAPMAVLELDLARTGIRTPVHNPPDLVVVVAGDATLSPALAAARQRWLLRRVPLVTVIGGTNAAAVPAAADGRVARAAVDRPGDRAHDTVVDAIFDVVEPERRLALARQFPALRRRVCDSLIEDTARINAGYAFTTGLAEIIPLVGIPFAIGDLVVLTKNQLVMSYRIALACGKQGSPSDLIGEIVGVVGGSLLFRQLARELVGMVPLIGLVPKVAVAYGGTWAIGKAVVLWAAKGEMLTTGRLRQLSRDGLALGRKVAGKLKRGEPEA